MKTAKEPQDLIIYLAQKYPYLTVYGCMKILEIVRKFNDKKLDLHSDLMGFYSEQGSIKVWNLFQDFQIELVNTAEDKGNPKRTLGKIVNLESVFDIKSINHQIEKVKFVDSILNPILDTVKKEFGD